MGEMAILGRAIFAAVANLMIQKIGSAPWSSRGGTGDIDEHGDQSSRVPI
jgi:hypothetical protein